MQQHKKYLNFTNKIIINYRKKIRPEHVPIATLDVDDPLDLDASDDDDSEDDAEELMLELQKIKKERMAEEARMVIYRVILLFTNYF